MNAKQIAIILLSLLLLVSGSAFTAQAQENPSTPVVKAILFWMDGCPHCHDVIDNVLPPIQAKYGDQFQLLRIELVGGQEVVALYDLAESMGIPKNDVGVPFLIIGDRALVGSGEIPAELPGLIEQHLAEGGVDFPQSPALASLLPQTSAGSNQSVELIGTPAPQTEEVQPTSSTAIQTLPTVMATTSQTNVAQNSGFTTAILTMIGMIIVLLFSGYRFTNQWKATGIKSSISEWSIPPWQEWLMLILLLAGIGVAGYLAYVETQAVPAVCGPVGDCNTVQSSSYARLFGVLPIGVLGVIGYLAILAAWIISRLSIHPLAEWAALANFGMTFGGVLFSIYLTYLEPFVIKAVCMWCVSSAVIMTALLLLNLRPAMNALKNLKNQPQIASTARITNG